MKQHNQKIKFSWDIPNKELHSFDKTLNSHDIHPSNLYTSCPSGGERTVLLIDDQIEVLVTLKAMLQRCDYAVNAFNDPLLALDHFRGHAQDYGIVISGMMMPSMSGLEFIKKIRMVSPEIATFIIASLDDVRDTNKDLLYDSTVLELDGIIHKPILLDDLSRSVERAR
jgi:CheY-like chemotaxis protein